MICLQFQVSTMYHGTSTHQGYSHCQKFGPANIISVMISLVQEKMFRTRQLITLCHADLKSRLVALVESMFFC